MIQQILGRKNINEAMMFLKSKENMAGFDGVKIKDLPEYWKLNKDRIIKEISEHNYHCSICKDFQIVEKKGKVRWITNLCSIDKLIQRAMYQVLKEDINKRLSEFTFAFRKGINTYDALLKAKEYIDCGKKHILKIDLKNYYDNINHNLMLEKLPNYKETEIIDLIHAFMKCKVLRDDSFYEKEIGLIQGAPISPLLANYYLNDFDRYLENEGVSFIRYADDISLFFETDTGAAEFLPKALEFLENEKLSVNNDKTYIALYSNIELLGYKFIKDSSDNITIQKSNSQNSTYYKRWNKSNMEFSNGIYHIINDGILRTKDFSLIFENKNQSMIIPPEVTDTLNVYSNVILSPNIFNTLNEHKITLNIYNRFDSYIGSFVPANNEKTAITAINQMKLFCNDKERMKLAKKIEMATAYNINSNLKYYYKTYKNEAIKNKIDEISDLSKDFTANKSIDDVLITEAKIRQTYFSCFDFIINSDGFRFEKRSRRPPHNALNAMISFGNTLLYQSIATEIRKSSLDIKIGFIHSPNRRSETLHLDIAEIFKPIIVDRTVFSLINKNMIKEYSHFEKLNNGVHLNGEGKRILIDAFYKKLNSQITVKDETITFHKLIVRELNKLTKHINHGEKYIAYKNY